MSHGYQLTPPPPIAAMGQGMPYGGPTGYGIKSKRVKQFILQDTGSYNQMVTRPLTVSADPRSYDAVVEAALQSMHYNKRVTPTTISQMASTYISPSARPEALVNIPNGWDTKRLRFVLTVEYVSSLDHVTESMVYGYTDYYGVSDLNMNPVFDPNMVFYINGVVDLRVTTRRSAEYGTQQYRNVTDFSDVVYTDHGKGINSTPGVMSYKVVPESVFNTMASSEINAGLADGIAEDLSSTIGFMPSRIKKSNSCPSEFISDTINSYNTAISNQEYISDSEILSNAATYAQGQVHENSFINQIRQHNGHGGRFTLQELLAFDPGATSPGVFAPVLSSKGANSMPFHGNYNAWTSSDIETQMAQFVATALPAIMVKHNVTEFGFTSTNEHIGGTVYTEPHLIRSNLSQLPMTVNQALVASVDFEIIPAISFRGEVSYSLQAKCNIYGNVEITLSINGGPPTPFIAPAFASSLASTNVTLSKNHLPEFSSSISGILNEINAQAFKPNVNITPSQTLGGF